MLKSILKCTFAVLCFASSNAVAQDYSSFCCCEDNQFNGFYIGGNIGVTSHTAHRNDLDGFLTDNSGWSTIDTGFVGGIQGGYDWQCGSSVYGLLVDWDGTTIGRTLNDNPNDTVGNFIKDNHSWLTTIRGRAGLAVSNSLIYVTGGAAVAKIKTTWNSGGVSFNHNDTRWGWVGGFGTEYALCNNWDIGAEVLYLNFANKNKTFTTSTFGHSDSSASLRFFLNWRFSDLLSSYN